MSGAGGLRPEGPTNDDTVRTARAAANDPGSVPAGRGVVVNGPFSAAELDRLADLALAWTLAFVPRLVVALLIFAIGVALANWAGRGVLALLRRSGHVDATVQPVVASVVRYALVVLVAVWALGQLGVQTASLLAVLGAAGLAVGLALQGTLTNIAAGIMLLWLRPFRIGDYVEVATAPIAGTVREIGLFACRLETVDGVTVFAPNQTLWNTALRNYAGGDGRLVAVEVALPKEADAAAARAAISSGLEGVEGISDRPLPDVFVDGLTGDGLVLTVRVYALPGSVGALMRTLPAAIRAALDACEDETLHPLRVVRTAPSAADPSRLMR
ncbi:small-conductance mechanosensitive channel [Pleomorphomonas sp. SM30]|uniref:Small-conductance mechanosensitive channel n=1 Tax=Oharaeibacter diazotrophicus TaxID=1920512 RepID=A0A4V6PVD8_9HYPH|nr:small conductance mechanosensitive channel [Oharaeibacter diazotrophicus]BBE72899.1 small-conductance mechanosensitive channel [Pleomorphomonas sp. SM30]